MKGMDRYAKITEGELTGLHDRFDTGCGEGRGSDFEVSRLRIRSLLTRLIKTKEVLDEGSVGCLQRCPGGSLYTHLELQRGLGCRGTGSCWCVGGRLLLQRAGVEDEERWG